MKAQVQVIDGKYVVSWEELMEAAASLFKNEMNFGHAALNSELADGCKDYE